MALFEIEAMVRDITFIKTCGVLLLMKSFCASEKMATISIPSLWLFVMGHSGKTRSMKDFIRLFAIYSSRWREPLPCDRL